MMYLALAVPALLAVALVVATICAVRDINREYGVRKLGWEKGSDGYWHHRDWLTAFDSPKNILAARLQYKTGNY